jgi:protein TonB
MYGHAQHSGRRTRAAGATSALVITAAVAYGLSVGVFKNIMPPERKFDVTFIEAPKKPEILPLPEKKKVEVKPTPQELVAPPLIVTPPPEPVITAPVAPPAPAPAPEPAPITNAGGDDRTPPKLIAGNKPEYPAASVRAGEEGITRINVCVTDQGRVTTAVVSGSSGSPRLDEAAVRWVRSEKFKPGTVGGKPQSMCDHDVSYQWSLKNAG